ncbi:MAG: GAF domain-containing protein [Anaerolineales bacterium]|nr:GAF domain-containing protein [Anaerolineales bacterium]WKZ38788.1 MAG: GAF domain-containing protein [Anaerolineales bacterium]
MTERPVTGPSYSYTQWRTGFIRTTLIAACIFGLAALIPAVLSSEPVYGIIYIIFYILVLLVTFLQTPYTIKAGTLVTLFVGLAILSMTETGILGGARLFMLSAITLASLLFSWRIGWVITGFAILLYSVSGWLILNNSFLLTGDEVQVGTVTSWITDSAAFLLVAVLIINGIRLAQTEFEKSEDRSQILLEELRSERETLEQRVQERTSSLDKRTIQLQAVADVGKSITSYRDLSELLRQAAQLIHDNFGYYHVGIFLLDERREYAVFAATNSEGGKQMLENGHRLKVGGTSIVGYVTENLKARIALDVGQDAVYFDNPFLPETRSEMALPLVAGGQLFGVLDVQSKESQAFTEDDIATLQILAEQIAVAIQNANLFSETERALETARVLYGEASRDAWSKIIRSEPRIGYVATPPATTQTRSDSLDPDLAKAFGSGDLITSSDGLSLSIPITVRGQVIGAIRLRKPEIADAWTEDETSLAIALSDQLSSALESARLYRESQQRAARESLVSDISARLSAASQIDAILRETVQELGQAIGNASVSFQLLDQAAGPNGSVKQPENGRN